MKCILELENEDIVFSTYERVLGLMDSNGKIKKKISLENGARYSMIELSDKRILTGDNTNIEFYSNDLILEKSIDNAHKD